MSQRRFVRAASACAIVFLIAWNAPVAAQQQTPAGDDHAQHQGHTPDAPQDEHAGHTGPHDDEHAGHDSMFSMRDASGTAWSPDEGEMYGVHRDAGAWQMMLHGNAFLQFIGENANEHRGDRQFGSINWVMAMARRSAGSGRVGLRGMASLEPWTIGGCGYPNLLATGETCDGDTIHDKQHPHDLFMELAAEYERPLTSTLRWNVYGGPVAEPALGPVAFPHRLSAMANPFSPIGHHWLDATHISFGVLTTGVSTRKWKAEASLFNGREPDERRWDFDFGALDSYSGRLWFMPTNRWALQISAGHLEEAEAPHATPARTDVDRVTASATYHRAGERRLWASTIAWGHNQEPHGSTHALLAETSLALNQRHTWIGRAEVGNKPADALHAHELSGLTTVGKLHVGYTRYFSPRSGLQPGVGGVFSLSLLPESLAQRYGGRARPGAAVYVTLRPAAHQM